MSTFNSLLSAGALNNASTSDLAMVATQTGIPVSMLQSIVTKQQSEAIKPQVISNNGSYKIIDERTGKVISEGSVGGGSGVASLTPTQQRSAVSEIMKAIGTIDSNYQTIDGQLVDKSTDLMSASTSKIGDRYLSPQEEALAQQKAIELVGDVTLGKQLFQQAMDEAGYKLWKQ
jgi:hypothetical protein